MLNGDDHHRDIRVDALQLRCLFEISPARIVTLDYDKIGV